MIPFITVSLLIPLLSPLVWQAEGRAEAEQDIAAGAMKWKIYGYMAGLTQEDIAFTCLMRERYGVDVEAVAQCCVTTELVERVAGYNARINDELDAKFGPNAIERASADAAKGHEQQPGRYGLLALVVLSGGSVLWRRVRRAGRKGGTQTKV